MTEHAGEIAEPVGLVYVEQVYVEWDEPGAGAIVVNGKRLISFNVETDWDDKWNPQVSADAVAWLDRLPRLVQDRDNALRTAQRYERMQELVTEREQFYRTKWLKLIGSTGADQ